MEVNPIYKEDCDMYNDTGCMEDAEFKFTDTALIDKKIITITLGHSCSEHVEEVRERLKKDPK